MMRQMIANGAVYLPHVYPCLAQSFLVDGPFVSIKYAWRQLLLSYMLLGSPVRLFDNCGGTKDRLSYMSDS